MKERVKEIHDTIIRALKVLRDELDTLLPGNSLGNADAQLVHILAEIEEGEISEEANNVLYELCQDSKPFEKRLLELLDSLYQKPPRKFFPVIPPKPIKIYKCSNVPSHFIGLRGREGELCAKCGSPLIPLAVVQIIGGNNDSTES